MNAEDRHLDDETISAALDGERIDETTRAHLDACVTCRARLHVFAGVAGSVGAPIAGPPPSVRESAIAAALATELAPARRTPNVTPWLAAAAVIVLLVVAVPLIGALSSGNDRDQATSARDNAPSAGAASGGKTAEASRPLDLGTLDGGNLAAVVGRQIGAGPAPMSAAAPSGRSATDNGGADAGAGGAAGDAGGAGGDAEGETLAADEGRACASQLQAPGTEVLFARGTWDDRPVVVFAYRSGDDVSAYVVSSPGCRILHFVRFRAAS